MIRVLMIVPRFETTDRGVEVFAKHLAKGLDKNKFDVTILSGLHTSTHSEFRSVQFPVISREFLSRNFGSLLKFFPGRLLLGPVDLEALSLVWRARHFLKKETFDIILPIGGTWTYRFAHWFKKNAKIISVGQAGPVKRDLAFANLFVALTPADEERAKLLSPLIPTIVIPNGVDLKAFFPAIQAKKNDDYQTILCVGAFSEDKRQDLLLDALAFLGPRIECILVGDGPTRSLLEAHPQAKKGRVKFLVLPHEEMPKLYHQANIFTLPALNEAFGLVFLEALASGLPVVANDGPRQRFVIGEAGIYCDVTDSEAYAAALESALVKIPGDLATRRVEKFAWPKIIGQYEKVILQIIRGSIH